MSANHNPFYTHGVIPADKKAVLLLVEWTLIAEPMKYDFGPEFSISFFDGGWIVKMDEGAYASGEGKSTSLGQAAINACNAFMEPLSGSFTATDMYQSVKELRDKLKAL